MEAINTGLLTSPPGRYAKALFNLAKEENSVQKFNEQLQNLTIILEKDEIFEKIFKKNLLSKINKMELWEDISKELNTHKYIINFGILLLEANRFRLFIEIIRIFNHLKLQDDGIIPVTIISSQTLELNEREKIETFLSKRYQKNIQANYREDKFLLGGFTVQYGSEIINASLKEQFNQLVNSIKGDR